MAALLATGHAHADDYTDVNQLLRNGKSSQALERADTYLAKNARDPQMRFLRAVALTDSGKTDEAIAALNQLIEDYPELPEPYNNLAVIYAGRDQLDKARSALESAVRNNPGYGVAYENLGDIHARLAYQAYAKAQGLDGRAASVRPKLKLLRELLQAPVAGTTR
ncbi:Predicted methyltransferase (contains TPR repeat) [Delftia tsuruhatensis]|nr:Predicted methyltransferase (contains TPR repeat) [Delftia tsuruhatensis]CAC9688322.1 Predicted methyltransferase (contains TPR repeat) [Delftia tsuruhatensis]